MLVARAARAAPRRRAARSTGRAAGRCGHDERRSFFALLRRRRALDDDPALRRPGADAVATAQYAATRRQPRS